MKNRSLLIAGFAVVLLLGMYGCGEDSSSKDDLAPLPPIPISRSNDADYPQRGVRPNPSTNYRDYWVLIEWERNAEEDIKGYIIRRGSVDPNDGPTYSIAQLEYGFELQSGPEVTEHSWTDKGKDNFGSLSNVLSPVLGEPRDYFWQIAAYDETGNRSQWSDTIRYTLIENPTNLTVTRFGADDYDLSWEYPTAIALRYKIRVYSYHDGLGHVMWDPPLIPGYTTQESVRLNRDGTANEFVRDCTYVWQLNAIRDDESGAALYTTFIYSD